MAIEPDAPDTAAVAADLRSGAATLGWVRVAELADLVPEVAALSVPFLFRDPEKALAILDVASLGPLLDDQLRKQGLEPLGYLDGGALGSSERRPHFPTWRASGSWLAPAPCARSRSGARRRARGRRDGRILAARRWQSCAPTISGRRGRRARADPRRTAARLRSRGALRRSRPVRGLSLDVRETLRTRSRRPRHGSAARRPARRRGAAVPAAHGVPVSPLPEDELGEAHARVKAAVIDSLRGADPSIVRTVLAYAD